MTGLDATWEACRRLDRDDELRAARDTAYLAATVGTGFPGRIAASPNGDLRTVDVDPRDDDPLGAARGCFLTLGVALLLWLAVFIWLAWR